MTRVLSGSSIKFHTTSPGDGIYLISDFGCCIKVLGITCNQHYNLLNLMRPCMFFIFFPFCTSNNFTNKKMKSLKYMESVQKVLKIIS
jgi:hypothetical protein